MSRIGDTLARQWRGVGTRFLPFADVATVDLPLGRLLRLSLFQVSVGMALVLLNGTLNRVMILELGVPSSLVALMIGLPLMFAPLRALIGHRSDTHRSFLGWRRVPYLWFGTLLQFAGFAIMPFALLILSGDTHGPVVIGTIAAAVAFLLVGAGMHTVQTAGLALAGDLAPAAHRPRVIAFLYVMLLVGTVAGGLAFGVLLEPFTQLRLIQVIQGAAVVTIVLNLVALWKQEARDPSRTLHAATRPTFAQAWQTLNAAPGTRRLLVVVGLGTMAFGMQDILLEPYGGEILNLGVGATTILSAILAAGSLAGFALAAAAMARGFDPFRLAANGLLVGIFAFCAVIFAGPLQSAGLFRVGTLLIGFGGGLFAIGTLVAAMDRADGSVSGLAVGGWGAVQATAAGLAIAGGGALRDLVSTLALAGHLGPALRDPSIGYSAVYHLEIALLFATLVAIGPLIRVSQLSRRNPGTRLGLAELPT